MVDPCLAAWVRIVADGDGDGDATGGLLGTYSIYRISLTTEDDPPQVLDAHIPVIDLSFQ